MKFFVLMALVSTTYISHAQSWIYPETLVDYNTLRNLPRGDEQTFLSKLHFWVEGGHYIFSRDSHHRWDVSIGGVAEVYYGPRWNLQFETNFHLVIDPNNNIAFNPRAFVWEEGLLVGTKSGSSIWQIGYQHRCKHDVDNFELFETTGRIESRSLIYGSAFVRWSRDDSYFDATRVRPLVEGHFFLALQDQRFPVETRSLLSNVAGYIGALRGKCEARNALSSHFALGVLFDLRLTLLSDTPQHRFRGSVSTQLDAGSELFLDLTGETATIRFFARYALQPDHFITPVPGSSRLFAFGLRLLEDW